MGLTSAQAKGRIKNIASKNGADPRVLMRIYMMERFLERVSLSDYKDNFIIKGGMLITSMVGISMRSTMDIDTTVKGQDLNIENAQHIVSEIAAIRLDDGVSFIIKDVTVFLTVVCISMKMQFMDLLVQFLFPMVITAGICFVMLNCSFLNEATSILGCFIWGVIWWGIAMNNAIYERIAMPIWIILFVFAICFLIGAVYKTIHECNRFLEVNLYGITNG